MTESTRIAVVTGGNRGLGRSTALHLAAQGTGVILTYRANREEAEQVAAEVRDRGAAAVVLQLDVGTLSAFPEFTEALRGALADQWGRDTFDVLVNNAGIGHAASFADTSVAAFDELLGVHFRGVFFLTQALVPLIADGGRIVNLSTGLTRFTSPGLIAYASMKGAIEVFTRHLAQELGPRGITVNAFAPGPIATDFSAGMVRDTPAIREALGARAALGRVGEPDDVGAAIAALTSDANAFITGQRIEASGGSHL